MFKLNLKSRKLLKHIKRFYQSSLREEKNNKKNHNNHPNVNHAGSFLAGQTSHLFLLTINLFHQHMSLAVMRAAVKQDPAGRHSKGKEWETERRKEKRERQKEKGTAHCSALSLDVCDLCLLYVSVGNPICQFQQMVLWEVGGRKCVCVCVLGMGVVIMGVGLKGGGLKRKEWGEVKEKCPFMLPARNPNSHSALKATSHFTRCYRDTRKYCSSTTSSSCIPSHFQISMTTLLLQVHTFLSSAILRPASLASVQTGSPTKSSALLLIWFLNLTHCIRLSCVYPSMRAWVCECIYAYVLIENRVSSLGRGKREEEEVDGDSERYWKTGIKFVWHRIEIFRLLLLYQIKKN